MRFDRVLLSDVLKLDIDAVEIDPAATYQMSGVYGFGRGLFHREPLQGTETSYKRFHRLAKGKVVLSQLKGWEGGIAVVDDANAGRFLSTQFPTFTCDESQVLVDYVGWFLRFSPTWEALRLKSRGMGARRDTISPDKLLSLSMPLPSLDAQRDIVRSLNRVSALVDKRRRAVEASERQSHAMLSKAFQRAIDGALLRPMAEVAPLVRRQIEITPDQDYTEIGVRSFYKGIFHRRTLPGSEFSWQKLFTIKEGDLVFSNLMAWEKAIAVASLKDEGTVGNHRMLTCEVDPAVAMPSFLMAYFRTADGFASVVGHSPGTIARNKTLSSKKLPTIEVPVPPLDKQLWFHQIQEKAREVQGIRARTAKDIDALMPALLHEIFGSEGSAA